jgi:hypothetical protein
VDIPSTPITAASRVTIPSGPVECVVENVGSAPTIAKSSTFPAPPNVVVPAAPSTHVLARAAYRVATANEIAFNDILPLQSIARLETQRHILLKPTIGESTELADGTEPSEQSVTTERSEAELQPKLDVGDLASVTEPVKKIASSRTITSTSKVATFENEPSEPVVREEPQEPVESDLGSVLVKTDDDSSIDRSENSSEENTNVSLDESPNKQTPSEALEPEAQSKSADSQPQRARLVLHVPADAEVYLMGRKMVTTGKTRLFNVPIGEQTKLYSYRIRVKAVQGHAIETTQWVRAGQRLELTIADVSGRFAVSPPQVSVFE